MSVEKLLLLALVATALLGGAPAAAAPRTLTGTIEKFECGDNCYLTVRPARGEAVTALCVAATCAPWNRATRIPPRLIGARVVVTMGVGHQYDGSGADMGEYPSFTAVKLAP